MSSPVFVPLNTGDTSDDDGQVLDSLFIETDTPPEMQIEPLPDRKPIEEPARTTRLLTGNLSLNPLWTSPTLLLPADGNRKDFYIRVTSSNLVAPVVTDYIWLADESGKTGTTESARLFHGQDLNIGMHTGPLYVSALGSTEPLYVSYWSTTR